MAFCRDVVLPRLCDLAMRNPHLVSYRKRVVGSAQGCVLEIWHRIGLEPVFRGAPVREILCETTTVWRLSQLHDLSPWQPCSAGSERWGESRLGDSRKVISDLLAAFRGSLINKAPRAEHLNRTQEVGGSNPLVSTTIWQTFARPECPFTLLNPACKTEVGLIITQSRRLRPACPTSR
jgi:hypothetical protein